MAALSSTPPGALRPVALVAALNATCQGLVGVVLSVLALCVCFCSLGSGPTSSTNNDFAAYVTSYLQGDECHASISLYSGVTGPTALRIWICLSLLFSASMMVSSVVLVMAVALRWSEEKLQIALVSWLFINLFTAIDDLILGSVFSSDFSTTLESTQDTQDNFAPLALGVITFLAFRGGYLWLLNISLILYIGRAARDLHFYLTEQVSSREHQPIQSWPTLDDFGKDKDKVAVIERTTPSAVNPQMSERVQNGQATGFPEHTALARWPTLNGQAHTMRESRQERPEAEEEDARKRRARTVREPSLHRQEGFDNPTFQNDVYYLRLQSETGSTRDFEENPRRGRDWEPARSREEARWELPKSAERDVNPWELPKSQERDSQWDPQKDHSKREVNHESSFGYYRQNNQDLQKANTIPATPTLPSQGYTEENGIPIPPVDYHLDPDPELPRDSLEPSTNFGLNRPSSLQQAILDRTLRLKKVPEELKKGFKYTP